MIQISVTIKIGKSAILVSLLRVVRVYPISFGMPSSYSPELSCTAAIQKFLLVIQGKYFFNMKRTMCRYRYNVSHQHFEKSLKNNDLGFS